MELTRSFLFVFTFLPAIAVSADIKQWVDQDGNLHFGDQAPVGVSARTKTLSDTTEIAPQPGWRPRTGEQVMLRRHEDRGRKLKEAKTRSVEEYRRSQKSAKDVEKRKAQCDHYRKRLDYHKAKLRQGYKRSEKDRIVLNISNYETKVKLYCD